MLNILLILHELMGLSLFCITLIHYELRICYSCWYLFLLKLLSNFVFINFNRSYILIRKISYIQRKQHNLFLATLIVFKYFL